MTGPSFNSRYLAGIGGVVLDIGRGAFVTKYRFARGTRYYGLDITSRATHVRGDAHRLPFQDQSVDWVLLVAMLEHVTEPRQVPHEAFRVLRPGGGPTSRSPSSRWSTGIPTSSGGPPTGWTA